MKTRLRTTLLAALVCAVFTAGIQLQGAIPSIVSYQGRIQVDGSDFTGTGQFKFALVDGGTDTSVPATATATVTSGFITDISVDDPGSGYLEVPGVTITDSTGSGAVAVASISSGQVTDIEIQDAGNGYSASPSVSIDPPPVSLEFETYWSNDDTSVDGGEPAAAVPVSVSDGLFTVELGDAALDNMVAIPPSVFANDEVHLRIWFDDGVNGFQQLSSDQPLNASPYALRAAFAETAATASSADAADAAQTAKVAESANSVDWRLIENIPAGFDDNVDNDTTYSAGGGLNLSGSTLSIAPGGVGANQLANNAVTSAKLSSDDASLGKITGGTMTDEGNQIGIGTATPDEELDVVGDIKAQRIQLTTDAGNGRMLQSGSTGFGVWTDAIRNSGGDIGIGLGSDNPSARLHVSDGDSGLDYTGTETMLIENNGVVSLVLRSSIDNSIFGHEIAFERPIGEPGMRIHLDNDDTLDIGRYTRTSTSGSSFAVHMRLDLNSGDLGIGRTPASNTLEVDGNASKSSAGDWLANSDRRIKQDIRGIENARETVMQLRPVKFRYTDAWRERNPSIEDHDYYNFIAQEYREVFPESVKGSGEFLEGDEQEILQVDTYNAQVVTIKAVQELIEENRRLREELKDLKNRTEERLNRLESAMNQGLLTAVPVASE